MSKVIFSDIYQTEVAVEFSRSGYIRLDFKTKDWPERLHLGEKVPYCVSMTKHQAAILFSALGQLLEEQEGNE